MVGGAMMLLSQTAYSAAILEGQRMHPVEGKEGMVVTSHFLATQSAQEVLKNGGGTLTKKFRGIPIWQQVSQGLLPV